MDILTTIMPKQISIMMILKSGTLIVLEELVPYKVDIINILNTNYNPQAMAPEDARSNNIKLKLNDLKLEMKESKALWSKINSKLLML